MMIGEMKKPKPPVLKPRPIPRVIDVEGINMFAHMAPEPNTCYDVKLMQYRQRKCEGEDEVVSSMVKLLAQDKIDVKYAKHFEKFKYAQRIKKQSIKGMREYEKTIDVRRDKLRDLLAKEERELYREVIDTCQRAIESTITEKLEKLNRIREQTEVERAEIAHQKTMQKYLGRCDEFRPVVIKQRLIDSKNVQLLQIQENESKKEAQRELDKMWHDMKMKEKEAQDEREAQDQIQIKKIKHEFRQFGELQGKVKKYQLEMEKLAKQEECKRLDEIRAELKQEELNALMAKRKKREDQVKEINRQLKEHDEEMKIKNAEIVTMTETYNKLADEELYKEQMKIKNKANTEYSDMQLYNKYLAELKKDKVDEDKRIDMVVQIANKEMQHKQETEKCRFEKARRDMQTAVIQGRKEQIEYKRKQEEEKLKFKKEEEELVRQNCALNLKLKNEEIKQKHLAGLKYRDDLEKQVAYSKILKQREQDAQNRMLEDVKVEEKLYNSLVDASSGSGGIKISPGTHPFRGVMEADKCPCLKHLY